VSEREGERERGIKRATGYQSPSNPVTGKSHLGALHTLMLSHTDTHTHRHTDTHTHSTYKGIAMQKPI